MKLSFSQCSLLSSVKNGDLSSITSQIEELARAVEIFISNQQSDNFRQHLYTFTFTYIIQTLQGRIIETQPQNVIIEIIQAIREFKSELFDLVAQSPNMSFFDFMVSQQFNDLYDVLTASEKQLNGQLEPVTPKKVPIKSQPSIYFDQQARLRSQSMEAVSRTSLQQNNLETDFAMLQQFVYDQLKCDSPRIISKQNPQLFSFDSTFVRDLPLSKYNGTSNYDDSQFNFTLQKESTADAIQTSRFESERIEEEEYFGTDQSSSDLDRSYREWDARFRLLAEKEKQVAQRELKTIIQEKHLNKHRIQMASPNNKENTNTYNDPLNKVVKLMESTYKNKEQTFKNWIIKRIDVFVSGINENQQMNYIPIQQRAQLLMQEKQQRIAENKRIKEINEQQELSRYSFRPNIGKEREQHRTVDQFLEEVDYWIERKNEAIHQLQQEKQQQELRNLTFKPTINKKSQRIVQDQNLSMQDRSQKTQFNKQYKEQQYLIEELKKTPFSPQLNATSVKLLKKSATPERCKTPTQFGENTPRIGKSPYRKQTQRVSTQATPNRQKSNMSTAVSSNNYSKKEPLQNVTNHMKFIVDLINKPPTKPLF